MESGKWKMESGKWKVENGKWKVENLYHLGGLELLEIFVLDQFVFIGAFDGPLEVEAFCRQIQFSFVAVRCAEMGRHGHQLGLRLL